MRLVCLSFFRWRLSLCSLAFGTLNILSACGSDDQINLPLGRGSQSDDDRKVGSEDDTRRDDMVVPPKEYYDALMAEHIAALTDPKTLALAGAHVDQVLWVNFDGVTLQRGYSREQSFLLCKANATVPAADLSPAQKDQVVVAAQAHFSDANAKLIITTIKPANGDYTTIHVGGAYRDLGCNGSRVLGIAPFDVGNANRNDIGFAFVPSGSDVKEIAETISHEAGHSFGLDHVTNNNDLMYAASSPSITGFLVSRVVGSAQIQDAPALLKKALGATTGSTPPTTTPAPESPAPTKPPLISNPQLPGLPNLPNLLANLPGLVQIGNIGTLISSLSNNVLDISKLLPQLGGLVPGGLGGANGLQGLDKILTIIGLATSAGTNQNTGSTTSGPAAPSNKPNTLIAILNPLIASGILGNLGGIIGLGSPTPPPGTTTPPANGPTILGTLASLGGFGSVGAGIGVLQTLLNGLGIFNKATPPAPTTPMNPAPTAPTVPTLTTMPDLSQLLGIGFGPDGLPNLPAGTAGIGDLLLNFTNTARVIAANYQDEEREALLSLLKVAYSQAYAKQMSR